MSLRRSIGLVWLGRKPDTAAAVTDIAGLRPGNLAPGTHLVTSRRGYLHHGIYVGSGMVVHYAGLSGFLRSGPVEEVTMVRFSRGRAVRIIEYSESKYSPQEIVLRARSRLGENEYQVLRNNCEHFCNWCISGRSYSTQVESPLASTLRALGIPVHGASGRTTTPTLSADFLRRGAVRLKGRLRIFVTSLFARDELAGIPRDALSP